MDTTSWISQDRIAHIRTESYTLSPRPTDHCFSSRTKISNSFPQSHKIMCDAAKKTEFCNKQNPYISTVHWCNDMQTCKTLNRIASNKVSLESNPCIIRVDKNKYFTSPPCVSKCNTIFFTICFYAAAIIAKKCRMIFKTIASIHVQFPKCRKKKGSPPKTRQTSAKHCWGYNLAIRSFILFTDTFLGSRSVGFTSATFFNQSKMFQSSLTWDSLNTVHGWQCHIVFPEIVQNCSPWPKLARQKCSKLLDTTPTRAKKTAQNCSKLLKIAEDVWKWAAKCL